MSAQTKNAVSGLGISGRKTLLVYKRHHLRGRSTAELAGKNENLPGMQRLEIFIGIRIYNGNYGQAGISSQRATSKPLTDDNHATTRKHSRQSDLRVLILCFLSGHCAAASYAAES